MADQIPPPGSSQGAPSLRPVNSSDRPVLLQIFAEAHCAGFELAGLEPAALAGLVAMQHQARQAQYIAAHPDSVEYLICAGGDPVGSCWLDDTAAELRVLDIAVLRSHRRRGIARAVLGQLHERAAAAGKPVRLSVWQENQPALALYRELGFVASAGNPDQGNGYLVLELGADHAPQLGAGVR